MTPTIDRVKNQLRLMKRNQKTKESLTNPENKPKATEMNKIIIILRTIPLMLVTMTLKLILQAGE